MPYNHIHKIKRKKNYILLVILLTIFALLYYVTIMKFSVQIGA